MKNALRIALIALMVTPFAVFFSCSTEDTLPPTTEAPTVFITAELNSDQRDLSSGDEVIAPDTVIFKATVSAPGGFNVMRTFLSGIQINEVDRDDLDLDAGTTTVTLPEFAVPVNETSVNTTLSFSFTVVDENNLQTTVDFDVAVGEGSPDARRTNAVIIAVPLGGQTNTKTFYAVGEDMLYSRNDVENTADPISPMIDFGYFYGSTELASLASPNVYPSLFQNLSAWGTRNQTKLVKTTLSTTDYSNLATIADVDAAIASSVTFGTSEQVNALAVNDVVAFRTDDGLDGFIWVKAINGTFNTGDNIEIELVINEE